MTTQFAELNESPAAEVEKDLTSRSIIIGIACTALFHILLVWFSPQFAFDKFSGVHSGISVTHSKVGKTFDFELAETPPKPKDPFQFVETNSAAPENTPDKTSNFSNRNQQSAQEVAAKEKDPNNRPSVSGQDKIKSDAIVTGSLAPPMPSAPQVRETAKDEVRNQQEEKARAEQVPLSGFDKTEGKADDGIATSIAKSKSQTNHADKAEEGAPDAKDPTGGLVSVTQANHAQPKDRPRLSSASLNRTTILTNRAAGVTNIGVTGIDARWSEYGEYLQELLEIIQVSWYRILEESRVSPPHGSHVVITFKINSKGETNIVTVEDTDSGKQGVFSCQNAITYPQPYRKWTEQMIALLGEEQQITLSFYYQ